MTYSFDPLVPRPIDRPTPVPLDGGAPAGGTPDAPAAGLAALDEAKIFAAPDNPADWPAWRERLHAWREDARTRHAYDGAAYDRPNARWASRCFTVAQVWLWDELLYSFDQRRFTPERLVADARERFGGLDAVVLWHAYPVIGIDDRNQWDYYRDVPGLTQLVEDLHGLGLKVLVDYNPWDTGTRRGQDDVTELADLVRDLEADGVFLDTLKKADPELVDSLERARPGIVLEGESKLAVERIVDHNTSWAQFFADSAVPGVLRAHWYERRHMQHHIRRWHRDHSEELQSAWLNGVGVMVWEVVFGVWVGWNARDAATVRRMVTVQRAAADLLLEGEWSPLAEISPEAHAAGVYASTFAGGGVTLWALANRGDTDWVGPLPAAGSGHGAVAETGTVRGDAEAPSVVLDLFGDDDGAVIVPARSVGAALVLAPGTAEPDWLPALRERLAVMPFDDDARFPHRLARRLTPTVPAPVRPDRVPGDAVVVPAGEYVLTVRHRARETGMYQGAPYVDEWKPLVPRLHDARTLQRDGRLELPVAVGGTEVTNAEFADFLAATGYRPAVVHRFLAHFDGDRPPAGREDEPVTFVDLDDARAYCTWRGGRLPSEDEWQLAAEQGLRRAAPEVWNWTESEHSDGRSRFVMLKGGSAYACEGSEWYFDGGVREPEFAAKLLVPGLGLARSSSIGFRCAWTLEAER